MLQPGRLGLDPVTDEEMEHMEARLRKNYRKMGNTDKWSGFARVDFPFQSAATAPTCPDTCSTCSDQFLPKFSRGLSDCFPMRMHDDEQAASLIADLIHSTKENHAYVRAKIDEYGNAISRRWKKKSVTKRTELLQTAKPNIYPKKRALIELMFETTDFANATSLGENAHLSHDEHRAEHWKHGETYLTPYLDAQSLSEEPLRLLAMMHYRSHTDQADWISFDREQCHIGFQTCHIQSAYNPHCVTVCGENFGKLVQWDKNAAHRWDTIGYPFARLIFKAQHRISDFLREIVDLLLQNEIDKAPRGRDEWDDLVASAFKQKKSYIGKSAYCEQAFSAAPSFDAERIVKLFRPRLNAASDQLWQMQTDPIYARHIVDRMLLLEHLSRLNKREQQAKQSVAPLRSVIRTEIWVCLHAEAETLLKVQEIYGDRIRPGTPLPKLYEMAMDRLELHLKYMFDLQVRLLNHLAMCLPTFRHHVTHESGNTYRITTLPRVSFYEDPLFWNLSEFREYDYCLNPAASMYFSWIDEILYNSSDMKRIDQELHDHLSDMATVDEAISAIKYHRSREGLPRSPKDFEKMSRDIGLSEDYGIMVTNWAWCTLGTPRIEEAFRSFMNLPLPSKKVDQGTLTQYKDLHDALSNYWAEVRVEMKAKLSQFPDPSERFLKLPIDRISASLSTEYRENIEQEQEYLLKEIETNGMYRTFM